jgi:hypothetical protein
VKLHQVFSHHRIEFGVYADKAGWKPAVLKVATACFEQALSLRRRIRLGGETGYDSAMNRD